jgi:hypothetical protein
MSGPFGLSFPERATAWTDRHALVAIALLAWVSVLLLSVCGCRPEVPSRAESLGLASEYIDVHHEEDDAAPVLQLHDDGSFTYVRGPRTPSEVAPAPETLGRGEWELEGAQLQLRGDGWTVAFVPDSTWVEIPRGATMMRCLRWVTSTEGSPFSASDLVSRDELAELLHPTAGSGSSQF